MTKRTYIRLLQFTAVAFALLSMVTSCNNSPSSGSGSDEPTPSLPIAEWARGAVIYHVYVRSFLDADGDGHGDFAGLTSKLDYIQALGADAILLLPIIANDYDVYGGYAPTSYLDSEPDYGSLSDFDDLIVAAHARDLKVLIDLPLDLSANTHPYFIEASSSVTADHHDWYAWADSPCPDVQGYFGQPAWNYVPAVDRCYWSKWATNVPEWNYRNSEVREMMCQVAEFWLARGVGGFRLDSAPGLDDQVESGIINLGSPGTHAFWAEFMARVKSANPEALCVAEVFCGEQTDLNPYYANGIDMAFDYPIHLNGLYQTLLNGDVNALASAVAAKVSTIPQGYMGALFLGNHDVPSDGRAADVMSGNQTLMTLAAGLLFSLPGTPSVYFGEEIGLPGAPLTGSPDNKVRNPMQWDASANNGFTTGTPWTPLSSSNDVHVAAQDGIPGTMLETYRGLIAVRKLHEALRTGSYTEVSTADSRVYAFLRETGGETILVLANLDDASSLSADADLASVGITSATVTDNIWSNPMAPVTPDNADAYGPMLDPRVFLWLQLE